MKKNILVFGVVSGVIISAFMAISIFLCYRSGNFSGNILVGYTAMLVAFSFIFVAIKNYRDKYNNGLISFGKAFKMGLLISLIASSIYVITWLIDYYVFIPDFMDKFTAAAINETKASGASQLKIDEQMKKMESYKELYKNPVMVILFTYLEILPIGLVVSLISALILKRKSRGQVSVAL